MKRKLCIFGAAAFLSVLMVGCMETYSFLDGAQSGYYGYNVVGAASSSSSCASLCSKKGYSHYRYNPANEVCYCK